MLSELEREQFFTTSTDAGLTYHYHQVLQTHLEVLLVDELGGRAARELYSRSGALLEQAGRHAAAIRAHARAEDWGSVARLLKPDTAPVSGDETLWGMLSLPGAPNDDPGLVLAGARRLARNGQIAESVVAFRQAEALLDDPEFRRRCTVERSTAAIWLPQAAIPPMPAGTENAANSTMLRLSLELRQVSRQVRDPYFSPRPLTRGLALLLAGDLTAASRELRGTDPGSRPAAAAWEPLAERLTARLIDLMIEPDEVVAGQVEEIMLSADVQGWPWLSRIARGLQAAMLLAAAPAPWRISAAAELLDDLERGGDRWTVCLTSLAIGAVYARIDQPDLATRTLRRTEEVAAALGAPVLGAWASVLRTAVAVRQGAPGAEAEAAGVQRGAVGLGLSHAAEAAELIRQVREPAPGPVRAERVDGPRTSAGSPGVSLRCLGGFSLAVAGAELPWRELRPRVRALLMLLAMNHGRQLHREQLVDALWPDSTLASGIRSLQVAVSSIRQCLGAAGVTEDALRRHGDAYALQLPGVIGPVGRLRAAGSRGRAGAGIGGPQVEAVGVGPVRR